MDFDISKYADEIVDSFLRHVGKVKEQMATKDLKLLRSLAEDSAKLTLKSIATGVEQTEEIAIVNASLENLKFVEFARGKALARVFWNSVFNATTVLAGQLIKVALASI